MSNHHRLLTGLERQACLASKSCSVLSATMTLGTAAVAEERFLLDEGDNRVPIGP